MVPQLYIRSHAPTGYLCPFCAIAGGAEADAVVYKDDTFIGVLGLHQKPGNEGHLLLFPVEHHENLYGLPAELAGRLLLVGQRIALALKDAFEAEGVTLIQNNEPAGDQDVWHVHLHIIPRFNDDNFLLKPGAIMPMQERERLASRMISALDVIEAKAEAFKTPPLELLDPEPKDLVQT